MKNKLAFFTLIFVCAISLHYYSYSMEVKTTEIAQQQSMPLYALPKDMLNTILSFLVNTQAVTVTDYFNALDSFRVASKKGKQIVDTFVTQFLAKNNVIVQPGLSEYKAFKNYIISKINQEIEDKAKQEKEDFTKTHPNEEITIPIALSCLNENLLWKNKEKVSKFVTSHYLWRGERFLTDERFINAFHSAIEENKLLAIKLLLPFIDLEWRRELFPSTPIGTVTYAIQKLEAKLKANPNDPQLLQDLATKKEILKLLQETQKSRTK